MKIGKQTKNVSDGRYLLNEVVGIYDLHFKYERKEDGSEHAVLYIIFHTNYRGLECVKFANVSCLNMKNFSGGYTQTIYIEIVENTSYEMKNRLHVSDYENQIIEFYCESYQIINESEYNNASSRLL